MTMRNELPPDHWIVRGMSLAMFLPIVALSVGLLSVAGEAVYRMAALWLSALAIVLGAAAIGLTMRLTRRDRPQDDSA